MASFQSQKQQSKLFFSEEPPNMFRIRFDCDKDRHGQLTSETNPNAHPVVQLENYEGKAELIVSIYTWHEDPQKRIRHPIVYIQGQKHGLKTYSCVQRYNCLQASLDGIRLIRRTREELKTYIKNRETAEYMWKKYNNCEVCLHVVAVCDNKSLVGPVFSNRIQDRARYPRLRIHRVCRSAPPKESELVLLTHKMKKGENLKVMMVDKETGNEEECKIVSIHQLCAIICLIPEVYTYKTKLAVYLLRLPDEEKSEALEVVFCPEEGTVSSKKRKVNTEASEVHYPASIETPLIQKSLGITENVEATATTEVASVIGSTSPSAPHQSSVYSQDTSSSTSSSCGQWMVTNTPRESADSSPSGVEVTSCRKLEEYLPNGTTNQKEPAYLKFPNGLDSFEEWLLSQPLFNQEYAQQYVKHSEKPAQQLQDQMLEQISTQEQVSYHQNANSRQQMSVISNQSPIQPSISDHSIINQESFEQNQEYNSDRYSENRGQYYPIATGHCNSSIMQDRLQGAFDCSSQQQEYSKPPYSVVRESENQDIQIQNDNMDSMHKWGTSCLTSSQSVQWLTTEGHTKSSSTPNLGDFALSAKGFTAKNESHTISQTAAAIPKIQTSRGLLPINFTSATSNGRNYSRKPWEGSAEAVNLIDNYSSNYDHEFSGQNCDLVTDSVHDTSRKSLDSKENSKNKCPEDSDDIRSAGSASKKSSGRQRSLTSNPLKDNELLLARANSDTCDSDSDRGYSTKSLKVFSLHEDFSVSDNLLNGFEALSLLEK